MSENENQYWVMPIPPEITPPQFSKPMGFCLVCGYWVSYTDPEAMMCPRRYLLPHGEIMPYVAEEFLKVEDGEENGMTFEEMAEMSRRAREAWKKDKAKAGKETSSEREVALSQEDFDLMWELLMASANSMSSGDLSAHKGVFGQGERLDDLTVELEMKARSILDKMAPFVATSDEPIAFRIVPDTETEESKKQEEEP